MKILLATDGSDCSKAAVVAVAERPWPEGSEVKVISAIELPYTPMTEAWALPGSHSMLTGLEATTINMEPDNPWRKIALWSTFKTRPDTYYDDVPADPANLNAQALRIESQPGTGFERGIVLSKYSLHASRKEPRPILVDLREVPVESILSWDLIAFPDGCRLRYRGGGRLATSC